MSIMINQKSTTFIVPTACARQGLDHELTVSLRQHPSSRGLIEASPTTRLASCRQRARVLCGPRASRHAESHHVSGADTTQGSRASPRRSPRRTKARAPRAWHARPSGSGIADISGNRRSSHAVTRFLDRADPAQPDQAGNLPKAVSLVSGH